MPALRYLVPAFAVVLLLTPCTRASTGPVIVLDQNIESVTPVGTGKFFKIAWKVTLKNTKPKAEECLITFSFLDSRDRVIGKATKEITLKGREQKTVSDTVQLRASKAKRIAAFRATVGTE